MNKFFSIAVLAAMSALLASALCRCGYDKFPPVGKDDPPNIDLKPNSDIGLLREICPKEGTTIFEEIVIEGYVTANDRSGNFFKTFIIQDDTGAAEINAGISTLHNFFPYGRRVVVKAKGLAINTFNDVLQIGRRINPYSSYRVEGFGSYAILDRYLYRGMEFRQADPLAKELKDLDRVYCGRLVRSGMLLADIGSKSSSDVGSGPGTGFGSRHSFEPGSASGPTWAFAGGGGMKPAVGYKEFRDAAGDSLLVVTSPYANFASVAIPTDSVTLTGILIYGKFNGGKERFGLKLRDLGDVMIRGNAPE